MRTFLVVFTLALASLTGHAEGLSLQLHGASHHVNAKRTFNEANLGLGLRYQQSNTVSFQGGFYDNSVNKTTVYLLAQWEPLSLGSFRAGVFGGVASGYQLPVVAGGMVSYKAITLRVIPKTPKTPLTFGLEVGIPF